MRLKEVRRSYGLTQKEAALLVGVPLRTYVRYEDKEEYSDLYKYNKILEDLINKKKIDEEHGILTIDQIKSSVLPVLEKNGITYCFLFGSYSRNEARENSDVDLLIRTDLTGLAFLNLIEEFRTALHKKVDLLRLCDIASNNPISLEILKEGIKIK